MFSHYIHRGILAEWHEKAPAESDKGPVFLAPFSQTAAAIAAHTTLAVLEADPICSELAEQEAHHTAAETAGLGLTAVAAAVRQLADLRDLTPRRVLAGWGVG
jgi:hypothetical protein